METRHDRPARIGLMGGTFDPIHYGHLAAAEAAREGFHLDEVIFVPTGKPPHKPERVISAAQHRYLMTVLATADNPYFSVSSYEINQSGPSYSICTVRHFLRTRGPHVELFFITGMDAVRELPTWHEPHDLLRLCQFIAVTRPGYRVEEVEALAEVFGAEAGRRIHVFEVPAVAVSSTLIRERMARGKSVRYLLPDAVMRYAEKEGIYAARKV